MERRSTSVERPPLQPIVKANGIIRLCCAESRNLQPLQTQTPEHRHGMLVSQCRQCGRKHFELQCDPGMYGLVG